MAKRCLRGRMANSLRRPWCRALRTNDALPGFIDCKCVPRFEIGYMLLVETHVVKWMKAWKAPRVACDSRETSGLPGCGWHCSNQPQFSGGLFMATLQAQRNPERQGFCRKYLHYRRLSFLNSC